jgi:hypothetical protein
MTDEFQDLDETVALTAEELDAMGVTEEEDETGAPEKVAWPLVGDEERHPPADESDVP